MLAVRGDMSGGFHFFLSTVEAGVGWLGYDDMLFGILAIFRWGGVGLEERERGGERGEMVFVIDLSIFKGNLGHGGGRDEVGLSSVSGLVKCCVERCIIYAGTVMWSSMKRWI